MQLYSKMKIWTLCCAILILPTFCSSKEFELEEDVITNRIVLEIIEASKIVDQIVRVTGTIIPNGIAILVVPIILLVHLVFPFLLFL